ncbi:MAG TPA: SURF1 family protein [Gammaproteobacteria bacterium]|nr:SURF1 family protein [Gammaproteobacteria bacterium]
MTKRKFRPGWLTTLIGAVVLAVLVSLGFWQIRRGHGAERVYQAFARGQKGPAQRVSSIRSIARIARKQGKGPTYRHVRVRGHYDASRQMLLDNRVNDDRLGYEVYTPLELPGGGYVIVDRGWVPGYARRSMLPDVSVSSRARTLTGMLTHFRQGGLKVAPQGSSQGWPRVVVYPDAKQVAQILHARVAPLLLLLDPDQPDGYVRHWKPHIMKPMRHYGYAFQWFAMAAALIVIWVWVNLRVVDDAESGGDGNDGE